MTSNHQRSLDRALWAGQWILAIAFELMGLIKLGLHAQHVRLHFGLAGEATTGLLHTVGMIEVVIAVAVILPALTRVLPQLSTAAAAGMAAIALFGIAWPASAASTGFAAVNVALAALAAFVVWGRLAKAPISPFEEDEEEATAPVAESARAEIARDPPLSPDSDQDPFEFIQTMASRLSLGHVPSHP